MAVLKTDIAGKSWGEGFTYILQHTIDLLNSLFSQLVLTKHGTPFKVVSPSVPFNSGVFGRQGTRVNVHVYMGMGAFQDGAEIVYPVFTRQCKRKVCRVFILQKTAFLAHFRDNDVPKLKNTYSGSGVIFP